MAGIIEVKTGSAYGMRSMVKEVPVCPDLQPATATTEGYISSTGISFAVADKSLNISSGFTGAGFAGMDGEMILVKSTSGLNDGLYTLVSDTDTKLVVVEKITTETAGAAGTVVIYGVAVYKITPTRRTGQLLIVFSEGLEAAGEVGMIPCVLNGSFWAAKLGLYTAFAATTVTSATWYLFVETAPYLQADGTLLVMLKPLATKQLYTDHRPALGFIELP